MSARRFIVDLSRSDSAQACVESADRNAAAEEASKLHPGFVVDGVVEIDSNGDLVAEHTPIGNCEGCGRRIWEGGEYGADADGFYTCAECMVWQRDNEAIYCCLMLVGGHDVPREAVDGWTDAEAEAAEEWAAREHLRASDNDDVERVPMPACVAAFPPKRHDPSAAPSLGDRT